MTLVDTSSWIHQLRPHGDAAVRRRVEELLVSGDACWCPTIRLELWNGARGSHEMTVLRRYEQVIPELELTLEVWEEAYALARKARAAGITCPSPDVQIAACARFYQIEIEAGDAHLPALMAL